jgi:hypothetical protein
MVGFEFTCRVMTAADYECTCNCKSKKQIPFGDDNQNESDNNGKDKIPGSFAALRMTSVDR